MNAVLKPKRGGGSSGSPNSTVLWVIPWVSDDHPDEPPEYLSVHQDEAQAKGFKENNGPRGYHTYDHSINYVNYAKLTHQNIGAIKRLDPDRLKQCRTPELAGVAVITATLPQLTTRLGFAEAANRGGLLLSNAPQDPLRPSFIAIGALLYDLRFIPSNRPIAILADRHKASNGCG